MGEDEMPIWMPWLRDEALLSSPQSHSGSNSEGDRFLPGRHLAPSEVKEGEAVEGF